MRTALFALFVAGLAAPAFAQPDPSWQRRRNEAAAAAEAARQQSLAYEREARAREQRARTEEALRALAPGELAGGPSMTLTPWRPSAITPLPPRPAAEAPVLTGEAARLDALMAQAMARSTARIRAAEKRR
jgi:hypothetical protein